jgi:Tol biopolymer transport system component
MNNRGIFEIFYNRSSKGFLYLLVNCLLLLIIAACQGVPEIKSYQNTHSSPLNEQSPYPILTPGVQETNTLDPAPIAIPSQTMPNPTVERSEHWNGYLAVLVTDKNSTESIGTPYKNLCVLSTWNTNVFCPISNSFTDQPIAWSPDSSEVIFSSFLEDEAAKTTTLHRLDLDTGRVELVLPRYSQKDVGFPASMNSPDWSKGKNQIVFSRGDMYETGIHLMSSNGLANYLREGSFPVWIENGQAIAYLRLKENKSMERLTNFGDLYRYDFEKHKDTLLIANQKIFYLAASPDGTKIAYADLDHDGVIYVLNLESMEVRELIVKDAGAFSWDPKGKNLFVARSCNIYLVGLDGSISAPFDLPDKFCYLYASLQPE